MWTRSVFSDGVRLSALAMLMLALAGCSDVFPKRTAGEKLYRSNCADCHGIDGRGHTIKSMGDQNANLLDDSWRHAGDASGMENVILQSLVFEHPTFDKLSREQVKQIVDHVLSLRGEGRR